MKKVSFLLIVTFLVLLAGFVLAKHFWRGETLKKQQVCSKWGEVNFNAKKFREGDEKVRAKMACSLLKNQKQFMGKDRYDIRKELGDHDGFYFTDMFPAYMIHTAKKIGEDSWQIVFLLNRDEKVSEIIVHKNCCEQ